MPKRAATGTGPQFDVALLRLSAGEKVFARGEAYWREGRVEIVTVEKGRVIADVHGSETYRSEVSTAAGNNLLGDCTCRAMEDWGFCKHCVAAALAANAAGKGRGRLDALREHLRAQSADTLAYMLLNLAAQDSQLLRELELNAAANGSDEDALYKLYARAITEATHTSEHDYFGSRALARKLDAVLSRVARLLDKGHARTVLRLMDHFFARTEAALLNVDDSGGYTAGPVETAGDLHLRACRAAKPDPLELARSLFEREMESEWDFFSGANERYRDVLGRAGLAEHRRLAEEAWKKIKPLRDGQRAIDHESFTDRLRLSAILEGFAKREGNLDARIAILAKDLSEPWSYLKIAQLCLDHGRAADALKWAEDGLWLFEAHPSIEGLARFAADLYHSLGRAAEAEALLWRSFERTDDMRLYWRLKAMVQDDPSAVRKVVDRAIAFLRGKIDAPGPKPALRLGMYEDMLIDVLLGDGKLTEAWATARSHGCGTDSLRALIKASEKGAPQEALQGYAELVERTLRMTDQRAYHEACALLGSMRVLSEQLGLRADHDAYVAGLAERHKAKRNFMKLLREKA